jgi:hypothetical protein
MSSAAFSFGHSVWELPPLILHPFNERVPPSDLLESSKAALMLSGLIADDGSEIEQLERKVITGRYAEIRMLFYIGKDVMRWTEQCVEHLQGQPSLEEANIQPQSLADLLTSGPPEPVEGKLKAWGVVDYPSIFARAVGLNAMFCDPPPITALSSEFLRNYHRAADRLFAYYMDLQPYTKITTANFRFQLFASGEYARMLEAEWGTEVE